MVTANDKVCKHYFYTLKLKQCVVNKSSISGSQDKGHAFAPRDIALNSCLIERLFLS